MPEHKKTGLALMADVTDTLDEIGSFEEADNEIIHTTDAVLLLPEEQAARQAGKQACSTGAGRHNADAAKRPRTPDQEPTDTSCTMKCRVELAGICGLSWLP